MNGLIRVIVGIACLGWDISIITDKNADGGNFILGILGAVVCILLIVSGYRMLSNFTKGLFLTIIGILFLIIFVSTFITSIKYGNSDWMLYLIFFLLILLCLWMLKKGINTLRNPKV